MKLPTILGISAGRDENDAGYAGAVAAAGINGASEVVARGISHRYGDQRVLSSVDLAVKAGDFVTLLGPSGSGKTTLLRIIAGLVKPLEGRVLVDGEDVTHAPPQNRGMGLVFQSYALFPHLTVGENIAFALKMKRIPEREQRRRTAEMLEMVSLHGLEHRRPNELSGGQQQRVALARALPIRHGFCYWMNH